MRVLVCVKRVPAPGAKINITADGQAVDTAYLAFTTSPHEECAVEAAVQLVEQHGGESTVLTLGPAEADEQLRYAASIGVSKAVLLPIETAAEPAPAANAPASGKNMSDYIYEPSQAALLDRLLPMYVEVSVFRAMLDSSASEHGARMTAMDSATNNAKKMIGALTLEYNRARQAAITKELMEIIGGAEAIKD